MMAKFHFDSSFSRSSCWEYKVTFKLIIVSESNTFPTSSQDTAKKEETITPKWNSVNLIQAIMPTKDVCKRQE